MALTNNTHGTTFGDPAFVGRSRSGTCRFSLPVDFGHLTEVLFSQHIMEDTVNHLKDLREGNVRGSVWKAVVYDDDGDLLESSYLLRLDADCCSAIEIDMEMELPDLLSVVKQALTLAKENAGDAFRQGFNEMLAATANAVKSLR